MKKVTNTVLLLILCVLQQSLFSCKEHNTAKNNTIATPQYEVLLNNTKQKQQLLVSAINDGDFKAYNEIANAYLLAEKIDELYYYSLLMANKHKCPEAFYHLFVIMNEKVTIGGVKLYSTDEVTINTSLYYLVKSKELGYERAQYEIKGIFGDKAPPPSIYFLKKLITHQ